MPHTVQPEASVIQTGFGLKYIGRHCFAYAGLYDSSTSEFEMLNFTTGAGYIFGKFILNGSILFTSAVHLGGNTGYKIELNGEAVSTVKIDTTGADPTNASLPQKVILPPFTKVILSCIGDDTSTTTRVSAYFVGRVYGAE